MPDILTAPISTSAMLTSSPGSFISYSLRETAGAAAVIRFRDGDQSPSLANLLVTISLNPSESIRDAWPAGIPYRYGLYLELVSGSIEGAAQYSPGAGK